MSIDTLGRTLDNTPYLEYAFSKLGTREIAGPLSNKDILEFHAHTNAGIPNAGDEIAWCASFLGWCLWKAGFRSTHNKAARSYVPYGRELTAFQFGAVCVFERASRNNPLAAHVAFGLAEYLRWIVVIGGNQANEVTIKAYPRNTLIAMREPERLTVA